MADGLAFSVEWLAAEGLGDPTAAFLGIEVAGRQVCRAENRWSRSVVERVPLSAAPLATWLMTSWWRLRWEAAWTSRSPDTAWRLAHEVGAAGQGFLWPRLDFVSDGETITAGCRPTPPHSPEMLRYLEDFRASVPAAAFESGVDRFVETTLERLDTFGEAGRLGDLWQEIRRERDCPDVSRYRRLEAMLGFDPGDAPPDQVRQLLALEGRIGTGAVPEIAAIGGGWTLSDILETADRQGPEGIMRRGLGGPVPTSMPPWERGRSMATAVRRAAGLDRAGAIDDEQLAGLLGLRAPQVVAGEVPPRLPFALARTVADGRDRFIFRRRNTTGRRFEAARMLCDGLAEPHDAWHPVTDAQTARQKTQRAFAAELLAPIGQLMDHLDGDFSDEAQEFAAETFRVSTAVVGHQLANQRAMSRGRPPAQI